jgi:hypothetical protein
MRIAGSPLTLAPLLFGAPVLLGIAVSLIRLLGVRYPDLGWATTVNSDAEQLYLGHTLYQNPAHGYTGQIYTPLFPAIVSLFDRLYLWNGWALVMVIGASTSLAALAARLAYRRGGPAPRVVCVLGAIGIGGVAYWCVANVGLPVLDEARADQVAWAFALFGLIAVADFGPRPSRRRVVAAALLLTAALWTKQTTVSVVAPAFAWVIALAALSALNRRAALLFAAVLCGTNLAILLVLNILTHGWEFYLNFELATHQWNEFTYSENVTKGLQSSALALVFVGVAWLASIVRALRRRRHPAMRPHARPPTAPLRELLVAEDPTGRRTLLLGIYVVSGFALAAYFMRKQGTETNQMIGVVWALGLLAALGWRAGQRHAGTAAASGACLALLFVLLQLGPIDEVAASTGVNVRNLEEAVQWPAIPAELRLWASEHTLYTPLFSDLNVPQGGPLYPNYYNFADLLAGGTQPLYVVHALLDRRFEGVALFPLEGDDYSSANGKWEENYLWKLDEVIEARYAVEPGLPEGILGRRPGPERAAWMRYCFGPFVAGGVSFRIHHGGGFWCSFSANHLQLVRTPAALSEVVTTQPVRLSGTVAVSVEDRRGAQVDLMIKGAGARAGWTARVAAVGKSRGNAHDVTISTYLAGKPLGSRTLTTVTLPGGRRGVRLSVTPTRGPLGPPIAAGPGTATLTAPVAKAPFALVATSGSAVDLHAVRLAH